MLYLATFVLAALLSFLFTLAVRRLAMRFKIQDAPVGERKQHVRAVPLLGGLAPFVAFFGMAFFLIYIKIIPTSLASPLVWLSYSAALIMLGGFFDDKYSLPPKRQIWFPLAAIAVAVFYGGTRIHLITNPYGGVLFLIPAVSLVLSFLWLFIITYTTKILDGLDGLVSGTVAIGALTIFLFTTLTNFKEAGMSYLAIVLAGVFIGFLILNYYPVPLRPPFAWSYGAAQQGFAGQAKIFLGEGGSLFAGFILGGLAIMTGAKIAVTLMVLALPLIDLLAVIIKRIIKKKPFWKGDRLHLHYLLVDRGWKPQHVVYLFWGLSAAMGLIAVFLPSGGKVASLILISIIFFAVDIFGFKEK